MTISARITALAQAIATDIKDLYTKHTATQTKIGTVEDLQTTAKDSLVVAINEIKAGGSSSTEAYSSYATDKDSHGIYRIIEIYTGSGYLHSRSTLSGGSGPQYTTRTLIYYNTDGSVKATQVYTLSYDGDVLINETLT